MACGRLAATADGLIYVWFHGQLPRLGIECAWTAATRGDFLRPSESYGKIDVTDREWALMQELASGARDSGGRPRSDLLRGRVIDAIGDQLHERVTSWRMLPRDVPPRSTV